MPTHHRGSHAFLATLFWLSVTASAQTLPQEYSKLFRSDRNPGRSMRASSAIASTTTRATSSS